MYVYNLTHYAYRMLPNEYMDESRDYRAFLPYLRDIFTPCIQPW